MSFKIKAVAVLLLASAVSPVALAAPTSGLLVTRVSSQQWQVQLIAGTQTLQLSGVVESDTPYQTLSGSLLESSDSVALPTSSKIALALNVYPGGVDRAVFTVASTAKLCLRDTGSVGVKIYRGSTLSTATLVSAPVALQGTDACGTPTPPPVDTARKYHPGHYIGLLRGHTEQVYLDTSIQPGVVGIQKRYTWRSLEPSLGTYDFSQIQADLLWAQANGMRMIVMIEDKTFQPDQPLPAYLVQYSVPNRAGGYTALRWQPYVVERFKALIKALGGRFDANPSLEGIATQETSLSLNGTALDQHGYTPEKYRDAYIDILTSASTSFPTSRIFWYMNFFPRNQAYIGAVATAVSGKGVVMGGPDVLPENNALVKMAYPYYDQFRGKLPLFGQVEDICYNALHETSGYSTKYWTMPELYRFGRDDLHLNYMIWVRISRPDPADAYTWLDALPVIQTYPTIN
jgi:hypothetical protein